METQTTKLEPSCTRTKEELEQAAREAWDRAVGTVAMPEDFHPISWWARVLGRHVTNVRISMGKLLEQERARKMVSKGISYYAIP